MINTNNKVIADNIPHELKQYRQWCVWKFETRDGSSKPTKVPFSPKTHRGVSVSNSNTWASFQECVNALDKYDGIGFILTENDPYCVMDFDEVKNEEDVKKYHNYYNTLNSFTEISPSGKGCHVWVKGSVPRGRNSRPFEIYSDSRFITVTGNVHYSTEIANRQNEVVDIWNDLGKGKAQFVSYDGDDAPAGSDQEIVDRASKAKNGYKFLKLWHGDFNEFYESQSEADFAIVDILAFYTQNMEQLKRLFRFSALGKREKAQRDDYVEIMIRKSFDRLPPKADLTKLSGEIDALVAEYKANQNKLPDSGLTQQYEQAQTEDTSPSMEQLEMIRKTYGAPQQADVQAPEPEIQTSVVKEQAELLSATTTDILERPLYFPDGLVGAIADFMYESAPRPVKEIALTAALGLMAGICGSAYNVSGSGLNMYIIVLAGTGTGKDGISSGIEKLMSRVAVVTPSANNFLGAAHIASPQALMGSLEEQRCCVSVIGEAGLWLKTLSDPNASMHVVGLRRLLLELYGRSGKSATLRPSIYADKTKNTNVIRQPAYSIIAESTQSTFLDQVDSNLIAEGFIPRWLLIEYRGERVPLNENHKNVLPSKNLMTAMTSVCQHVQSLMESYTVTDVEYMTPDVEEDARAFNLYCDKQINTAHDEGVKNLWTRSYLKAVRLAALVAVGCNAMNPKISRSDWEFAKLVVLKDTLQFCKQLNSGFSALGQDNELHEQTQALRKSIRDYLTADSTLKLSTYGATQFMKSRNVIPYTYFSRKLSRRREFVKSKRGATNALKQVIQELMYCGVLVELPTTQATAEFETSGKLYAVTNVIDILRESQPQPQ